MPKEILSKKSSLAVVAIILFLAGVFWFWQNSNSPKNPSLKEAGKVGEKATHKLMIQIENPKGNAQDLSGRYERGDIVLIFPEEHQFSRAEQEGFLIVQMDLTPKQAEILTQSLEEESFGSEASKNEAPKNLKRRKFTVDLSKLGIAQDDQKGREIEKRTFGWNIVIEK